MLLLLLFIFLHLLIPSYCAVSEWAVVMMMVLIFLLFWCAQVFSAFFIQLNSPASFAYRLLVSSILTHFFLSLSLLDACSAFPLTDPRSVYSTSAVVIGGSASASRRNVDPVAGFIRRGSWLAPWCIIIQSGIGHLPHRQIAHSSCRSPCHRWSRDTHYHYCQSVSQSVSAKYRTSWNGRNGWRNLDVSICTTLLA